MRRVDQVDESSPNPRGDDSSLTKQDTVQPMITAHAKNINTQAQVVMRLPLYFAPAAATRR
jgi:hypothetical protein